MHLAHDSILLEPAVVAGPLPQQRLVRELDRARPDPASYVRVATARGHAPPTARPGGAASGRPDPAAPPPRLQRQRSTRRTTTPPTARARPRPPRLIRGIPTRPRDRTPPA